MGGRMKILIKYYICMMFPIFILSLDLQGAAGTTKEALDLAAKANSLAISFQEHHFDEVDRLVGELLQKIDEAMLIGLLEQVGFLKEDTREPFLAWLQKRTMRQRAEAVPGQSVASQPAQIGWMERLSRGYNRWFSRGGVPTVDVGVSVIPPVKEPVGKSSDVATRLLFEDIQMLPKLFAEDDRKKLTVGDLELLNNLSQIGASLINQRIDACLAVLPREVNAVQALVIPRDSQVYVIGDLHSSFNGLLAQIKNMQNLGCFKGQNSLELNDNRYLVFTGDFVDRGAAGTEVLMLIMGLKELNPNNVFICRGNHEVESIESAYGFFGNTCETRAPVEVPSRFSRAEKVGWIPWLLGFITRAGVVGKTDAQMLKGRFNEFFSHLPVANFLGIKDDQGIVRFGMFNHAGFEKQANPAILQVLKAAMDNPGRIQAAAITGFNAEAAGGLLWGDYIAGMGNQCLAAERRGPECTRRAFVTYLNSLQTAGSQAFTIDFQARGHQHKDGGAFVLDPLSQEPKPFIPLQHNVAVTINKKEVFMFMSISESFNALYKSIKMRNDGVGQFMMNAQGYWVLTPYIIDLATRDQLAGQIRAQFMPPLP